MNDGRSVAIWEHLHKIGLFVIGCVPIVCFGRNRQSNTILGWHPIPAPFTFRWMAHATRIREADLFALPSLTTQTILVPTCGSRLNSKRPNHIGLRVPSIVFYAQLA